MEISILHGNILRVPSDLIVLKYADTFHGADSAVADALGFSSHIKPGEWAFTPGKPDVVRLFGKKGVAARLVLFIGVGPLGNFRYEAIQDFAAQAIKLAAEHPERSRHIALTIHGPGYGLDPEQSFLSLVAGIISGWKSEGEIIEKVTIVDRSKTRCELLCNILDRQIEQFGLQRGSRPGTFMIPKAASQSQIPPTSSTNIIHFGARAEAKPHLFVAMPFSPDFVDEFEIGFHEAARENLFSCERLDLHVFTGDIVTEMQRRIVGSCGVIALLNGHNPNVFLEVGFALAYGKPVILVARDDVEVPFDVQSHRYLKYRNITELRTKLTAEIGALKDAGVLTKVAKLPT